MTTQEKIDKTVKSLKQVTFGRVDDEWIDAFKEGMRAAIEAEEFEQKLKTCESCVYDCRTSRCNSFIQRPIIESKFPQRVDKTFGCNKWEQK